MDSLPVVSPFRVSLRDIARAVGVSHVTVSLALRGHARISPQRRREICAAAERMGYRPDPMLSSLAAYRQAKRPVSIGLDLAWLNQWRDPRRLYRYHEFKAYWEGAREAAERLGYRLEEIVINEEVTTEKLQRLLRAREVRGILIPPHAEGGLNLPGFDWSDFSIVRLGVSVEHPRAHVVTSDPGDNFRAGALDSQTSHEVGAVGVHTLAGLIHVNERGIPRFCRRILVEGRWVEGKSLPPR